MLKTALALLLAALMLTACGGGCDDPVPDHVCLVDGKPQPVEACR